MKSSTCKANKPRLSLVVNNDNIGVVRKDKETSGSKVLLFNHYFAVIQEKGEKWIWRECVPSRLGAA